MKNFFIKPSSNNKVKIKRDRKKQKKKKIIDERYFFKLREKRFSKNVLLKTSADFFHFLFLFFLCICFLCIERIDSFVTTRYFYYFYNIFIFFFFKTFDQLFFFKRFVCFLCKGIISLLLNIRRNRSLFLLFIMYINACRCVYNM